MEGREILVLGGGILVLILSVGILVLDGGTRVLNLGYSNNGSWPWAEKVILVSCGVNEGDRRRKEERGKGGRRIAWF